MFWLIWTCLCSILYFLFHISMLWLLHFKGNNKNIFNSWGKILNVISNIENLCIYSFTFSFCYQAVTWLELRNLKDWHLIWNYSKTYLFLLFFQIKICWLQYYLFPFSFLSKNLFLNVNITVWSFLSYNVTMVCWVKVSKC